MTAEIDSKISDKLKFDNNSIEGKIKKVIANKDYGFGVTYWGHIVICCSPELYNAGFFKEIKKYRKKDKEVEFRLRIDYEQMLKADNYQVNVLVCNSILRAINIAEDEFSIQDFDIASFKEDLISLFKSEGWL